MISTPERSENPKKRPAIPPNETNKSTQPNNTSLLYLIIGQVRNSIVMCVSCPLVGSNPILKYFKDHQDTKLNFQLA